MLRLATVSVILAVAIPASAGMLGLPNELVNGDFETGAVAPWERIGTPPLCEVHSQTDNGVPYNGDSTKWAGAITSWGGTWDPVYNGMRQVVDESQFPGWDPDLDEKVIDLQFDVFLGAHAQDLWRNVGIRVYLDWDSAGGIPVPGTPTYVRELVFEQYRDADPVKWAGEYSWEHKSIRLTLPFQPQYLSVEVETVVHFAEWSWVGIDNIDLEAMCVPEPAMMLLLGLPALFLRRRRL